MYESLNPFSETRRAAKAVLLGPDGKVPLAAGRGGMLNLPGGGFEMGESPREALYRELEEEGFPKGLVSGALTLLPGGRICGPGPNKNGVPLRLEWDVYFGRMDALATELLPKGEITRIEGMYPQDVMALSYPVVSKLAVASIARALQYI